MIMLIQAILPFFLLSIDEELRPAQEVYEASYFLKAIVVNYSIRADMRRCIMRRWDEIVQNASRASLENNVPSSIILLVGFFESHLGCHPRSGGNWGAPISRTNRLSPGTSNSSAHSLRVNYDFCFSHRSRNETRSNWERAVSRFRCGLCNCPHRNPRIIPMMPENVCRSTMEEVVVNNTRMCLTSQNTGYSASYLVREARRLSRNIGVSINPDI